MATLSFSINELKTIIFSIQKCLIGNIQIDFNRIDILNKILEYAKAERERFSNKESKFDELITLVNKIFDEKAEYKKYIQEKQN